MWDFSTEPEFQQQLDWMDAFVRTEVEPLDLLFPSGGDPYDVRNESSRAILKPLQEQVKARGLWACHLGPELGGPGYGQLKLALMNEILGRSYWAPTVFGTAAPDTGNARSSPSTARSSRRSATCSPCSTARSCRASR